MKHYLSSSVVWPLLCLIIINSLFFGFTTPTTVSAPLLVAAFVLVILTVWASARALRVLAARYVHAMERHRHIDLYVTAVVCTSLALSSLGQLSSRDFVLMLIAAVASYWYVGYQKRSTL